MRGINWSDEPYVRAYKSDHPDWNDLSWQAKGIYLQLRRKADRAGVLPLGMSGVASLAGVMNHSPNAAEITPFLEELIKFKWLELHGDFALIPEFIESENAHASPAQRTRQSREKRRDMVKLAGRPAAASLLDAVKSNTVTSADDPVTSTRAPVTSSVTSNVTSSVTGTSTSGNAARNNNATNVTCSTPFSIPYSVPDQIPPISPQGGSGGEGERVHDDPNLEDIRQKLMNMGKPLCYLPAVRAEERLYAPVMGGALTMAHVLAAIDDAAVSLGPDLGAVQPDDKPGLAALERFVAGCVKRARRDRHATSAAPPVTPRTVQPQVTARPAEPSPEALDVLDRFREQYTSVGNYDRFVAGPSDPQFAAEVVAECKRHAGDSDDWRDILLRAIEAYMLDDFYANQGHTLRRFAAVLKAEPARFIGRRRPSMEQQRADEQARKEHIHFLRSAGLLDEGEEPPPMPSRVRRPMSDERDALDHLYKQALAELDS